MKFQCCSLAPQRKFRRMCGIVVGDKCYFVDKQISVTGLDIHCTMCDTSEDAGLTGGDHDVYLWKTVEVCCLASVWNGCQHVILRNC